MRGVSITDFNQRHVLKVDLAEILAALGGAAEASRWALSGVEALGGREADELNRLSDERQTIDGKVLARLAARVSQVIDGEFRAFHGTAGSPWLLIYAVDSSAYDIFTDNEDILSRLRTRFHEVSEIPTS